MSDQNWAEVVTEISWDDFVHVSKWRCTWYIT